MKITPYRIPVTIITGFLGAGKTTLLNRIISNYPERRFAIIENEFGEIGIDSKTVINIDNNNICELANGCICCSLNDDLAELLKDLLNSGKPFEHLLVETTGIADPASVIQTFFSDFEVKKAFEMDSVICLADALHYVLAAGEQEEVLRQVAIADLLLLNKAGGQDPETLERIRQGIRSVNPHCEIYETDYADTGDIPMLERYSYRAERVQSYTLDVFRAADEPAAPGYGPRGNGQEGIHTISSHSYSMEGSFDIEKFSYWIEYFLYINQSTVFRIKGILNFEGNPHKMILQSVRSSYLLEDGDFWEAGDKKENRIVFIGRDLDQMEIREALENLMV